MLRLMRDRGEVKVVNDQIGSPTSTQSLAEICWALALHREAAGIFHWSDAGAISWYDFACAIRDEALSLGLLAQPIVVEPISSEAFPTKARRPAYSVLDVGATCAAIGVSQRPWRESLCDVLRSLRRSGGRGMTRSPWSPGRGVIGVNFVLTGQRHLDDQLVVLDALTYAGNRASLAPLEQAVGLCLSRATSAMRRWLTA